MSREKHYEVLGLKPDASEQEVKNAYRDLAKVWHPDRFAHDPRLQQKAQEKLKEINEAYAEINSPTPSRRARRPTPPPPHSYSHSQTQWGAPPPRPPRRPNDFTPVAREPRGASFRMLPLAFLAATLAVGLFVSYRLLTSKVTAPDSTPPQTTAQPADEQQGEEFSAEGESKEKKASGRQRAADDSGAAGAGESSTAAGARDAAPAYQPLPTVNRTIDPTTGLLATRACPLKALRTFASGQEPQKFCDADHTRKSSGAPPPAAAAPAQAAAEPAAPPETKDKSRLKSVFSTVASPGKWFRNKKETPRGETKTGAGQD